MNVCKTKLPGIVVLEPALFPDDRGYFLEFWQAKRYHDVGLPPSFVQGNVAKSHHGVLRGLHYQLRRPQGKLIWVSHGEILDVALDIQSNSPTFGQWVSRIISEENHVQIYISPGFAHGYCVLSDVAIVQYLCTDFYVSGDEFGVHWNDPTLQIEWPVAQPHVSSKDHGWPALGDIPQNLLPVQVEG